MRAQVLKNRNMMLLVLGKSVSGVGTIMQTFALSLYVLAMTDSPTAFASVLAVSMIPQLVLGPFAGVLVDRFDRKKIIVRLDILSGIVIAMTAVIFYYTGKLSMPVVYGQALVLSLISLLFNPAISTVIPTVVEKEYLTDANSLNSLSSSVSALLAPILAAFIYTTMGLFAVLVINAISFIASAISEMFIHLPHVKKENSFGLAEYKADFVAGIKYVLNQKIIFLLVIVGFFLNFAFNPFMSIGLLVVLKSVLKAPDAYYGYLQSTLVLGMIIAPFIIGKLNKGSLIKTLIKSLSVTALVISIAGLMLSGFFIDLSEFSLLAFALFTGLMFLVVILITVGNVMLGSFQQKIIPNDMLGRVITITMSITTGAVPLGQMLFGFMYENYPIWLVVILQSVIMFIPLIALGMYTMRNEIEPNAESA